MPISKTVAHTIAVVSIVVGLYLSASDTACADPNNTSRSPRIGAHYPTPLDRLCFPTEVFVAHILSASLADCRLRVPNPPTCDPKDELTFRLRVDETLGANEQELVQLRIRVVRPDESIDVVTKLFNSLPTDTEGRYPPQDEFGTLKVDLPTGEPLSDQEISRLFVGQQFIFGIRPNPFDKTRLPSATVWTMRLRQWVEDNLRNSAGTCSRLIQHANSP
jgi:hypothetical protein